MPSEEVIELSVDETNKLRAELGLAPLRGVSSSKPATAGGGGAGAAGGSSQQQDDQVLELSVDETNQLREKLGLAPLRSSGGSSSKAVHAPAINEAEKKEETDRIEKARVERQVKAGMAKFAAEKSLGEGADTAQSWAQQMRNSKRKNKKSKKDDDKSSLQQRYDEEDLEGLQVSHAVSDLQEGSTTVLTLADTSLLKTKDDISQKVVGLNDEDGAQLENVNLTEQKRQQDGLRAKRKMELGMGRAGGYSGYDDDEFVELGGSQAPSRSTRGTALQPTEPGGDKKGKKVRGFQIGNALREEQDGEEESDLFSSQQGRAISLEPHKSDTVASDFMTIDEDEALRISKKKKKEKKDAKFKKKKKKDKKKKKKQRKVESDDDEDEEDAEPAVKLPSSKGLLEELQETAVQPKGTSRKRRRTSGEDDDEDNDNNNKKGGGFVELKSANKTAENDDKAAGAVDGLGLDKAAAEKRAKFDAIMAKGNERTAQAFAKNMKKTVAPADAEADNLDDEPDDAFLNAALAKARRLNRLKQMAESKKEKAVRRRGAEAVVEAIQSAQPDAAPSSSSGGVAGETVTFAVDETREFTRALRARAEQVDRDLAKKAAAKKAEAAANKGDAPIKQEEQPVSKPDIKVKKEDKEKEEAGDDVEMEEADMVELAKEVKEDTEEEASALIDGSAGAAGTMGRGLGGVLGLLQQTGELTRKNAGKEEMRGRAKDKRTYEDYEALDLSKVVRIDERNATEKDRDLASREIKLEYRDKHGRLLTRKAAFRELSYQFHGYGSGKRKEEKRKEQITREQAEARLASRQAGEGAGVGTFGALKATQKATGKAFVVHKT